MEVIVHSTLSAIPGQLTIPTDPEQTVDSLLSAFCVEKGHEHRKNYVIRNAQQEILQNTRKIGSYGIKNGEVLFLGLRGNDDWIFGCNQWWLLAAVALMIGSIGIVAVSYIKVQEGPQPFSYGIVIDAGSSHSTLYVYKWEGDKENGTALAKEIFAQTAEGGGISSYADHPHLAGMSLQSCINGAKQVIPVSEHYTTDIFLGATAGMRLLLASDAVTCEKILESVRETLTASGFNFSEPKKMARIINGKEEGSFSWITANYLAGNFETVSMAQWAGFSPMQSTFGALDLGGASTQITFLPENASDVIPGYTEDLLLYGETYSVYTHSYLCYGGNEARRQFEAYLVKSQGFNLTVENPCIPTGNTSTLTQDEVFEVPCTKGQHDVPPNPRDTTYTFVGTSNSDACRNTVMEIFDFSAPCPFPSCTFNGTFQPDVFGEFKAFSSFYYTMSFMNMTYPNNGSLEEFKTTTKEYCSKSWQELLEIPHNSSEFKFLTEYCFNAHYIDILLTEAYKFDEENWNTITFQDQVAGSALGWSLGFMLNSSNAIPATYPTPPISTAVFIIMVVLFSIFLGVAVAFACHARISSTKAQSKYEKLANYGSV